MKKNFKIREMSIEDCAQTFQLWSDVEGVSLNDADTQKNIGIFLKRNSGLSFVVEDDKGQIVGAVLCGHDGRRGYLHHLAVHPACRKNGIARNLVDNCFAKLKAEGIKKCHLFVFENNQQGRTFWNGMGFHEREDIGIFSKEIR